MKVTEDGEKAMMNLSGGDMRRVLNILQSCSMAFDEVNEDNVYTCVGHPLKSGLDTKNKYLLCWVFTRGARLPPSPLKISEQ